MLKHCLNKKKQGPIKVIKSNPKVVYIFKEKDAEALKKIFKNDEEFKKRYDEGNRLTDKLKFVKKQKNGLFFEYPSSHRFFLDMLVDYINTRKEILTFTKKEAELKFGKENSGIWTIINCEWRNFTDLENYLDSNKFLIFIGNEIAKFLKDEKTVVFSKEEFINAVLFFVATFLSSKKPIITTLLSFDSIKFEFISTKNIEDVKEREDIAYR